MASNSRQALPSRSSVAALKSVDLPAEGLPTSPITKRQRPAPPAGAAPLPLPRARGLHLSTFRLNVSVFCGTGGAFRGCFGGIQGAFRGRSGGV